MSYCFNPVCSSPENSTENKNCVACGSPLLLNNRYRGLSILGIGRYSRTFLGLDTHTENQQKCVIKQFLPIKNLSQYSDSNIQTYNDKLIDGFLAEAENWQQVRNTSQIPKVFDAFSQDEKLYLVQEFIEGENLLEELTEEGTFSIKKIEKVLKELLPVLKLIHNHQLIHGNIKPENILRRTISEATADDTDSPDGELVLIDFGITPEVVNMGLASTGMVKLTNEYAPLEQVRCGTLYPASDLYSLGVTCMQLLTGVAIDDLYDFLKGGWRWSEAIDKIKTGLSEELALVLEKLLHEGLNDRYQSAEQALKDLLGSVPKPHSSKLETPPASESPLAESESLSASESLSTLVSLDTLRGHSGWVWSVSFSPDGKYLASGSTDHKIILWDLAKRTAIGTLMGHSDIVLAAVFSPDGKIIASGSRDKKIVLWDVSSCQPIRTFGGWFSGHSELVNSVVFSPDGQTLVSGGWDSKVILWDVASGKARHTLKGHSGWVYSVAMSPDGLIIASGSRDQTIILWNANTGKQIRTIDSEFGLVNVVGFSPDGRMLAAGGFQPNQIILWEVDTGERIRVLSGHTERVNALSFSPDGKTLASASRDEKIILWDLKTGTRKQTLTGHTERVFSVAFSPDGQFLASGAGDDTIKIWQTQ
jgi:serine/threonine protein kinase